MATTTIFGDFWTFWKGKELRFVDILEFFWRFMNIFWGEIGDFWTLGEFCDHLGEIVDILCVFFGFLPLGHFSIVNIHLLDI